MKLYLVQHGQAEPKQVDRERPLTATGRTEVLRVAEQLRSAGVTVSAVEHSGKTRAEQTAAILSRALAEGALARRDGIAPNDPVAPLVAAASELERDLMVVGHQPFMGRAAAALVVGRDEPPVVRFQPGSVACLARQDDGSWVLDWFVVPALASPGK